jgi:hypothetical protein
VRQWLYQIPKMTYVIEVKGGRLANISRS